MSLTSSIYDHLIIWHSSVTLTFNLPTYDFFSQRFQLKKFFFFLLGGGGEVTDEQAQTNLPLQLLWSWGHNNALVMQVMSLTSSIYDHFIIWPSSVTLTFNLCKQMFWTALLLLEDNNCAKLFWNPCINVPFMAQTSSIYDHFDIYLTPMTLTFNLPEKMFQMAPLLLEDNNCAKLFWNPCTTVQVMARTSSIYDHFDFYLTPMTLTFNLPEKMFQMALLLLEDNNCAKLFWNPCITVQVMARTSSIYDHFDFYLTPVTLTFNLHEKMFWMALLLLEDNNCAKLFLKSMHKCTSYGIVLYCCFTSTVNI